MHTLAHCPDSAWPGSPSLSGLAGGAGGLPLSAVGMIPLRSDIVKTRAEVMEVMGDSFRAGFHTPAAPPSPDPG